MTAIWAGGAFLFSLGFGWRMGLLSIGVALVIAIARRQRADILPVLLVVVAVIAGLWRAPALVVPVVPAWVDTARELTGVVITAPTMTGRRQGFALALASADELDLSGTGATACVTTAPHPRAGLGDTVRLRGSPRPLVDQAAASQSFMRTRGCEVSLFASSQVTLETGNGWRRELAAGRARFSAALQTAALGDAGALLSGLVTGDDNALSRPRQRAFNQTGTSHITAVSGSNVALVVTMLTLAGKTAGWRRRLGWQVAVVGLVWVYAIAVGAEAPVIRAALVASAMLLALRFGRGADPVTLIVLAAVAMAALQPAQVRSLSFQLSFAASLGIVFALNGADLSGRWPGVQAILRATLAAQIATLPILWLVLGQISPISLLANLLIAPLIALAMPLALLGGVAGIIWAPLGIAVILPARLLVELVFLVVDALSRVPGAMVIVGFSPPALGLLLLFAAATLVGTMSADAARRWRRLPWVSRPAASR